MPQNRIEIVPSVTVHALLNEYPELEDVLIGLAPPFRKLKNPVLRKSVAKVATLKHIASVGGIPLDELIGKLRDAVGHASADNSFSDQDYFGEKPDWFEPGKIVLSIEEDKLEDKNKMAVTTLLKKAKNVHDGEIIELVTSFLPAPGIDVMKSKGYFVWTQKEGDNLIKSYFLKNSD